MRSGHERVSSVEERLGERKDATDRRRDMDDESDQEEIVMSPVYWPGMDKMPFP